MGWHQFDGPNAVQVSEVIEVFLEEAHDGV
jgi:hypothetical protein